MSKVDSGKTSPYTLAFSPSALDSLDARAIQYKYALTKLTLFIRALDRIIQEASVADVAKKKIHLVHYISFCVTNIFAINESSFAPKLATIADFRVPKASTVQISAVVTHVPYDGKDHVVNALSDLPPAGKSVLCLKALKSICVNCLEGYNKRYTNACRELDNERYISDLNYLFENDFFVPRRDLDMSLLSTHLSLEPLALDIDLSHVEDGNYAEAALVDMDISALLTFVYSFSETLADLVEPIEEMRAVKLASKATQQSLFLGLPQKSYALHRLLFWAMRLNDLYLIFRKVLRQVFHSNLDHLKDRKFLSYVPNIAVFQSALTELSDVCNTAKKNGVVVATITRFIRSNSKHEVNGQSCLDFIGFVHQFLVYIEGLLTKLNSFTQSWIAGEMLFRTDYNLSTDNLAIIQLAVKKNPKTKLELRRFNENQKKEKEREEAQVLKRRILMRPKPRMTPTLSSKSPSPPKEVSSPDQSVRSLDDSLPSLESSTVLFSDEVSTLLPNIMYKKEASKDAKSSTELKLHRTSSTSSLPVSKLAATELPTVGTVGRARSSSLPLSFSASGLAFKSVSGKDENADKVPRAYKQTLPVVRDTEKDDVAKLSASQKFQQHLQQASRAGALLSKEKPVLTSVVFDPNNPSATNLRRSPKIFGKVGSPPNESSEATKKNRCPQDSNSLTNTKPNTTLLSSSAAATASKIRAQVNLESKSPQNKANQQNECSELTDEQSASLKPLVSTRAQITKHNTQRNSVLVQLDDLDNSSPSNESSVSNMAKSSVSVTVLSSETVKKVRFTGVKEWTPAEDAPTAHSKRILKNFASLKLTSFGSAFKQKDQMLKKEESISFKNHLNPSESAAHHTLAASYTLRFASFRRTNK